MKTMVSITATRADLEQILQASGRAATDANVKALADWLNNQSLEFAVAVVNLPDKAVAAPLF